MLDLRAYRVKEKSIAVVGLGYVGLPLALSFARHYRIIGYDINEDRILALQKHVDPDGELSTDDFEGTDIIFTTQLEHLAQASTYIVTVPTPIDEFKKPDLSALFSATHTIARVLKKGDVVIYESTVYPGCTEEECIPILERISGLHCLADFKVGYSPERINPGDKEHTFTRIMKVVSGCDEPTADFLAALYGKVVEAGIYKASSIKVAEAAKIIENTQRDVNIGLMNELSIIFHSMGINTHEVLEAARTKWNFLPFYPGLVGGHCIGVDPYYLAYKAAKLGYHPQLINAGRLMNDNMAAFVAKNIIIALINSGKDVRQAEVLILGFTFKENITDTRNSKVADLVYELQSFGVKNITIFDPHANASMVQKNYRLKLASQYKDRQYDVVVLAVPHKEFTTFTEEELKSLLRSPYIFFDLKSVYFSIRKNFNYWSL
ncbi:MAG TPA: nucleotide sugar dehydrogenase [Bacteroidales bacterium]|nr:nucleotide sugar dehydrogenase [Bacteroidales bacterium]HOK97772.1 nucleotide sugar dehydrogenase [Bacteroidales bacterium]HPO64732.1 nucleotide sugar dehydrogenase [Bacteroidales bacterium]